jgi:hypothetical protein
MRCDDYKSSERERQQRWHLHRRILVVRRTVPTQPLSLFCDVVVPVGGYQKQKRGSRRIGYRCDSIS